MTEKELLLVRALLDKQIAHLATASTSKKQGSSSSKTVGRSSEKSINAPEEIDEDEEDDEVAEEEEYDEVPEDYDIVFSHLTMKTGVTVVQGGDLHLDEKGQGWDTALGNAVKYFCTEIDKNWKQVKASSKKRLLHHMESKFGKGVMGHRLLYKAGRKFNHWKNWLARSKFATAPAYVKPKVWDRFRETYGKNNGQQVKASHSRVEAPRVGRRGYDGINADYYRDWGCYPSATTFRKIVEKGPYKIYRDTLIAQGRVPGNFKALDHLGKKGARKNKERKKRRKDVNIEVDGVFGQDHLDISENGGNDINEIGGNDFNGFNGGDGDANAIVDGGEGDANEIVDGDVNEIVDGGEGNKEEQEDIVVEGRDDDIEEENVEYLDGNDDATPNWVHDMLLDAEMRAPSREKGMTARKRKASDNASTSRKKDNKGSRKVIGRNLSPDFVDETVAKNIAQYKSIQKRI